VDFFSQAAKDQRPIMADETLQLLPEEIKDEDNWLRTLGLKLPASSVLLQSPFASPLLRRSYLVPATWHWQPLPELVAPDRLARDLPCLQVAIEKAYVGWERAAAAGWNWAEFFDRWEKTLLSDRRWEMPAHEAFAPWYALLRFQPDNHSGPRVANPRHDFSRTVYVTEPPPGAFKFWRNSEGEIGGIDSTDPAQLAWQAYLPDLAGGELRPVWAMSHPARYGKWEAVNADGRWIPIEQAAGFEQQRLDSVSAMLSGERDDLQYRRLSPEVAYLRIPTLSYTLAQQALQHREWLPADGFTAKNLVVDLRGNLGGAADIVSTVLNQLKGWREQKQRISFSLSSKESCLTDSLQWGHVQYLLANVKGILPARLRQIVQAVLYRVLLPSDLDCAVTFREHKSEVNYTQHQYPWQPRAGEPRIVILADGDCGSDGEFLVYSLALIPGSVVIGTCTAGVAQFARPGYFVLPSSRVGFRLASALSDIAGGNRSFDGYGLRMDVLTPQDAPLGIDSLLKLISLLPS
jgi:hypothetical protein